MNNLKPHSDPATMSPSMRAFTRRTHERKVEDARENAAKYAALEKKLEQLKGYMEAAQAVADWYTTEVANLDEYDAKFTAKMTR